MGCRGVETPVTPDEADVPDSDDALRGLGVDGWRRVRRVRRVLFPCQQAQRFLGVHAAVYNLFNLGRHLVRAKHYRNLRAGAFIEWARVVA